MDVGPDGPGVGKINVGKLHRELVEAELYIIGVSSDGEISWGERKPTVKQREQARKIVDGHDPYDPQAERDQAYDRKGLYKLMLAALWEHVVEEKSLDKSGILVLQEIIQQIKKDFPEIKEVADGPERGRN